MDWLMMQLRAGYVIELWKSDSDYCALMSLGESDTQHHGFGSTVRKAVEDAISFMEEEE